MEIEITMANVEKELSPEFKVDKYEQKEFKSFNPEGTMVTESKTYTSSKVTTDSRSLKKFNVFEENHHFGGN